MRVRINQARLAEELTRRRLSQNAWAHRIGISPGHLSNLLSGRRPYPGTATQRKLLRALEVSFGELFEIEADKPESDCGSAPLFTRSLLGLRFSLERAPTTPGKPPPFRAGLGWLRDLTLDVSYALRRFGRSPGFTAIAVLTLGLGLGANVAIFSVADKFLWKPLPYREPEQVFAVVGVGPRTRGFVHLAEYLALKDSEAIEGPVHSRITGAVLLDGEGASDLRADHISPGFLEVLGSEPLLGRGFSQHDHVPGSASVIVSFRFWANRLGGSANVIGETVRLREQGLLTVVGVLPPDFVFPDNNNTQPDLLLPLTRLPAEEDRPTAWTFPIVRLKPGFSTRAAEAKISALVASASRVLPEERRHTGARLVPLQDSIFRPAQPLSRLMLGAAGLLLLVACANVASLLLASGAGRREELALRSALGAGRWRLIRLLGAESLLVGAAAGLISLLIAFGSLPWLGSVLPSMRVRAFEARGFDMDFRVTLFALAAAVGVTLVVGLFPALRHSQAQTPLAKRRVGTGRLRGESALVFAEVSLALTLLIGSLLLVSSYRDLAGQKLGFETEGLAMVLAGLPLDTWEDREYRRSFNSSLLAELRRLPEIASATASDVMPIGGALPNRATTADGFRVHLYAVLDDYFTTLGIPIIAGRDFSRTEVEMDLPVAIVTESLAERLWPKQPAMGQLLPDREVQRRVIGVAADVRESLKRAEPVAFVPMGPTPRTWSTVARLADGLTPAAVKSRIRTLVPGDVTIGLHTFDYFMQREAARERAVTLLITLSAALSLVVTAVGLYGIVAYSVSRRTHEIGVRRALGATSTEIRSLVLGRAMVPVTLGLVAGIAAGSAASHLLEAWLWEISPNDPRAIAAAVGILVIVALAACLLPTRQAVRVDPREALQAD